MFLISCCFLLLKLAIHEDKKMKITILKIKCMIIFTMTFLVIGFTFTQTSFCQTHTVKVYGKVTDEGGNIIPQACVSFISQDEADTTSTDTDSTGTYSVEMVFKRTGLIESISSIPNGYKLFQNYPKPFNPGTVIEFELPRPEHVKLTIFNIKGQVVKVFADGYYPAGLSQVRWDGTNNKGIGVAAGIYFYRIEAWQFNKIKKMLLLDGGGSETIGSTLTSARKSILKSKMLFQETFTILA